MHKIIKATILILIPLFLLTACFNKKTNFELDTHFIRSKSEIIDIKGDVYIIKKGGFKKFWFYKEDLKELNIYEENSYINNLYLSLMENKNTPDFKLLYPNTEAEQLKKEIQKELLNFMTSYTEKRKFKLENENDPENPKLDHDKKTVGEIIDLYNNIHNHNNIEIPYSLKNKIEKYKGIIRSDLESMFVKKSTLNFNKKNENAKFSLSVKKTEGYVVISDFIIELVGTRRNFGIIAIDTSPVKNNENKTIKINAKNIVKMEDKIDNENIYDLIFEKIEDEKIKFSGYVNEKFEEKTLF